MFSSTFHPFSLALASASVNKLKIILFLFFSQESDLNEERSHQMAALRSLCLPRLTFLLLSVLQSSSRHQEALRLADIISSDQHKLYQVTGGKGCGELQLYVRSVLQDVGFEEKLWGEKR